LSLAKRISLIDSLRVTCGDRSRLSLTLIELTGASHRAAWWHNGHRLPELDDSLEIDAHHYGAGLWIVEVELHMKEVKLKARKELAASRKLWFGGCP
jgi:hypothetical protein